MFNPQIKKCEFIIKGMQRDLSVSKFNPEFAYENMNMRIAPIKDSTLASLTNEKGTMYSAIDGIDGGDMIGVPIGQSLLNNELTIFTTDLEQEIDIPIDEGPFPDIEFKDGWINDISIYDKIDRIYKLWLSNGKLKGKLLYSGHLGFDYRNPIETIPYYENDDIKKVYWTDGINQPRFINIAETDENRAKWTNTSFDFVRTMVNEEDIKVTRNLNGGLFPAGCVQYAFTYYNMFGVETNIFYTTPMQYTSFEKRGASQEDVTANSFTINIKNLDIKFDYVRIYSIVRTSIDNVPTVKLVTSIKIKKNKDFTITYTDTNTNGSIVDPTELFYLGGEKITAYTFAQKDNTLFLGNVNLKRDYVAKNIRDGIKSYAEKRFEYYNNDKERVEKLDSEIPYVESINGNNYNYLISDASRYKYFQKGEIYRFGIQFQHSTGKWSDVVWIGDYKNDKGFGRAGIENEEAENGYYWVNTGARAKLNLNKCSFVDDLIRMGYRKARPVVVYPTINERLNIAQGVLNPTMFNLKDRISKNVNAKASYFFRPIVPNDYENSANGGSYREFRNLCSVSANSNDRAPYSDEFDNKMDYALTIQKLKYDPLNDNGNISATTDTAIIDSNIVTLNSPDLEFDTDMWHLDLHGIKLKIIGYIKIDECFNDISITTTSTPNPWWKREKLYDNIVRSKYIPNGFIHELIKTRYGKSILSSFCYCDQIEDLLTETKDSKEIVREVCWEKIKDIFTAFRVSPWQQTGSLNNSQTKKNADVTSKLKNKKMSYMFSGYTNYTDKLWSNDLKDLQLWTSDQDTIIKLDGDIYKGNVDELVIGGEEYSKMVSVVNRGERDWSDGLLSDLYNSKEIHHIDYYYFREDGYIKDITESAYATNPINVKYKSNVHFVMKLKDNKTLPYLFIHDKFRHNDYNCIYDINNEYDTKVTYTTDLIDKKEVNNTSYPILWLGQLYRDDDNIKNRFGGNTDEALQANKFVPCGEPVELYKYEYDDDGNILINNENDEPVLKRADDIIVKWIEGDTYYQNYQCLKTYPFTLDDENSIVEILNFNVETRVNLAGRYDKNGYQVSNLVAMPTNFNLINNVYSQKNNFFTYSQQNIDMTKVNSFPNAITWTKTKISGDEIDTWTNITMASVLDLDGDKGKINKLVKMNDQLMSFQDKGISQILYNEQMQMSTTDGVPIEIANSGKVNGKRYLSEHIGCQNKWSICITPKGCYFIDNITKGIYVLGAEGLNNLSNSLGFHSWINERSTTLKPWNPFDFNNFVTYFDKKNEDILFFTDKDCLAFSEQLGQFTSFYSYEGTPYYSPIDDRALFLSDMCCKCCGRIRKYKTWFQHEGDYNMFFNQYRPFYTTVIANPEMQIDKVFNNLEFRSDTWRKDGVLLEDTFDTLKVWNEYQKNIQTLLYHQGMPSTLKKKFRVWYTQIPRDKKNILDRMRNPWLYLKLAMNEVNTNKTTLHDMTVSYFG